MPEIAEVRIVADAVADFLVGKTLKDIEVLTPDYKGAKLDGLAEDLPVKVTGLQTKGKFTWIELENGKAIGYGLGLTGNVRVEPTAEYLAAYNARQKTKETAQSYLKNAHLKIIYEELDGSVNHFYYHDIRRFGRWEYLTATALDTKLKKLGTDLLYEKIPDAQIIRLFRRKNSQNICKVLMDQAVISGIGNWMKAELLYSTRISPYATVKNLTDSVLIDFYAKAIALAHRAYSEGGASLYTFTGIHGDKSEFKSKLVVYNCLTDPLGNKVEKISDKESPDKRTTHWVPAVQTLGVGVKDETKKKRITIRKKME